MSTIAQSRDLSDRKTIENFAAVVQSLERLKLLTILTTADIRAVGPGVWNGWKAQLLRTLYYETEPVLTGGFSEVNRAQRVAMAQAEFRAELQGLAAGADRRLYRAALSGLLAQGRSAAQARARALRARRPRRPARRSRPRVGFDAARGVTELTVLAPDHPWLLSIIAGACAAAGANIVDAQIFTTTDGLRARHHRGVARVRARRGRGRAAPRASPMRSRRRCAASCGCRTWWRKRSRAEGPASRPSRSSRRSPSTTSGRNRYTVVEVTGLDRPGLLYELTATLSKLNLNIASAHVATFGERVVDVFYVTDLMGAKIASPTRAGGDQARAAAAVRAGRAGRHREARRRALGQNRLRLDRFQREADIPRAALSRRRSLTLIGLLSWPDDS